MPDHEYPTGPLSWGDTPTWPEGAPDLRPRGLILLESSLYFAGHVEEDDESAEDPDKPAGTFDWIINGHPGHTIEETKTWHAGLIGEIFVCREGWHLRVAAVLPVEGRGDSYEQCIQEDYVEARLGFWASHILWDFVSAEANRLLVGARVGFTLPAATPRPRLRSEIPEPEEDPHGEDDVDLDS